MRKSRVTEEPRLGLLDPTKPTSVVNIDLDVEVQKFINKVSKLSNHTVSSVITVMLTIQLIQAKEAVKAQKKK